MRRIVRSGDLGDGTRRNRGDVELDNHEQHDLTINMLRTTVANRSSHVHQKER